MGRVLAVLLACGCASAPFAEDVRARFVAEYPEVELRPPTRRDLAPARAGNPGEALRGTAGLAHEFLRRRPRDWPGERGEEEDTRAVGREVRAMLACCYLVQGRTGAAVELLRGLRAPQPRPDLPGDAVVAATVHAVDGCHAVEAYVALLALFEGQGTAEDFLARYGPLVGVADPGPEDARSMREEGFAELEGDPRALERVSAYRQHLREVLAGQIYDDTAELLVALPEPPGEPGPGPEACLAAIAAGLLIVYSEVFPDLLPERLRPEQKAWLREQVLPFYERGRRAAGHFLAEEEREGIGPASAPEEPARLLYARLLAAELAAEGWIETR